MPRAIGASSGYRKSTMPAMKRKRDACRSAGSRETLVTVLPDVREAHAAPARRVLLVREQPLLREDGDERRGEAERETDAPEGVDQASVGRRHERGRG